MTVGQYWKVLVIYVLNICINIADHFILCIILFTTETPIAMKAGSMCMNSLGKSIVSTVHGMGF